MFKSVGEIEKRVMEAVKAKIAIQQKRLEDGTIEIDKRAEEEKAALVENLVAEILNKIL